MKKFLQEFKAFAVKGNVIDLAVAVIIGGAFSKIVSSLVADVIMPPLNFLAGGSGLASRQWILRPVSEKNAAIAMNIGTFFQNVLDFLIISLVIFMMIKLISALKRKVIIEEEKPAAPPLAPPTKDQELLAEIRDLLKNFGSR